MTGRLLAVSAALLMSSGAAFATNEPAGTESQFGGVFSVWGLGVLPAFSRSGTDVCPPLGGDEEYCAFGYGAGGNLALARRSGDWTFIWDLQTTFHTETHFDPAERDEAALYGGAGLHIARGRDDNAAGIFGVGILAENHTDLERTGLILGGGAEVRLGGFTFQGGALFDIADDDEQDTFTNLFFARGIQEIAMGDSVLLASVAGGYGNFEQLDATEWARGIWLQLGMQLEVPIGRTNLLLLISYQGDFLRVWEEVTETESVLLNRVQLGFTMPFGGGRENVIFTTPDFTVPVTNAGDFN